MNSKIGELLLPNNNNNIILLNFKEEHVENIKKLIKDKNVNTIYTFGTNIPDISVTKCDSLYELIVKTYDQQIDLIIDFNLYLDLPYIIFLTCFQSNKINYDIIVNYNIFVIEKDYL